MEKNQVNNGNEPVEQEQDNSAENNTVKNSSGAASAFIFLAVVLSLSAGGITYLLFQKLEQTRTEFDQKMENTRNNLSQVSVKVSGDISGQLNNLTDKMNRLELDQRQFQGQVTQQQKATETLSQDLKLSYQQMRQSIDVLFKQKGRERIGWVLAEVEYLLLIANHSLKLQDDVHTAIAALEGADSLLLDTGDPGTIEIRTRIRDEIQTLKVLQRPDVVGMAATLSSVIKGIPDLPIKYSQVHTKKKIDALIEKKASHDADDLKQASKEFLHELRSLVVFRKMDESPKPLMTPEQQFFLQQNLQLKLETARRSLLLSQQSLFSDSLKEAIAWLDEFFDMEIARVRQSREELNVLQGMAISSDLPDISSSIKILRSYQQKLEKQQEAKQ